MSDTTTKLPLDALPLTIEQNACRLAQFDREIVEAEQAIAAIETEVRGIVAFDPDLKNEEQRRARRLEVLQEHQGYDLVTTHLLEVTQKRAECAALVERLRSELQIGLLQMRLAIATAQATSGVEA